VETTSIAEWFTRSRKGAKDFQRDLAMIAAAGVNPMPDSRPSRLRVSPSDRIDPAQIRPRRIRPPATANEKLQGTRRSFRFRDDHDG
jgi:hypothetical protein